MKVGDLVRPKARAFRHQVGIVISIGYVSILVRRVCGTESRYNLHALEVISEGR